MPRPPLNVVRVQLNIFEDDKATLEKHYGHGWTSELREIIKAHCTTLRRPQKMTIEQLAEEMEND